jgi:hypothetical protein
MNWFGKHQVYVLSSDREGRYVWNIGCLMKTLVNEHRFDCTNQGSQLWWNTAVTWVLTLCHSYLNPYCLGRKTAFISVGI